MFFIDVLDVFSFFRFTIIVSDVFIAVSLSDVRLSHLNKDYLLNWSRCLFSVRVHVLTLFPTYHRHVLCSSHLLHFSLQPSASTIRKCL